MSWTYLTAVAEATWQTLAESAPYLLFGFLVAGLFHGFVSSEFVARHLGRGKLASPVKAALFGIPLPLCSCGVIPAALNLRKKGASRGAVVSFLISTPETGVDSIALSYALLGPAMAVFRPIAALVTAVVAGVSENLAAGDAGTLEAPRDRCACGSETAAEGTSVARRLREGLTFAFGDLLGDLAPWLAGGFLVAGVITAAVPEGWVGGTLGSGPLSYLVMLAVGMPLYICATASTPIAAALIAKGLSPGAALVFLLSGPATNAATITALSGTLGLRTTLRYVASIALVSLAMGTLVDWLSPASSAVAGGLAGAGAEFFPPWVGTASAVVLLALALRPCLPRMRPAAQSCSGST